MPTALRGAVRRLVIKYVFPYRRYGAVEAGGTEYFYKQYGVDAFLAIYPGCSVIVSDYMLRNMLYDTLAVLAEIVTVGIMECLPDRDAALKCYESFTN